MTVLYKIASSLGRRDLEPNRKLAQQIVLKEDRLSLLELIENIEHKNEHVRFDCIQVLSEIAKLKPELLIEFDLLLLQLLRDKNSKVALGALATLDYLTLRKPENIFLNVEKVLQVADSGLLVSKDHAISILLKLTTFDFSATKAYRLFLLELEKCAINQYVKYAEMGTHYLDPKFSANFIAILQNKGMTIDSETKRKRVEALILLLQK